MYKLYTGFYWNLLLFSTFQTTSEKLKSCVKAREDSAEGVEKEKRIRV